MIVMCPPSAGCSLLSSSAHIPALLCKCLQAVICGCIVFPQRLSPCSHQALLCPLQESIRGCDVFLIQPSCPPVNDSLMELMVMIDACKRASARSITAVMPYFGYARADRKTQGRESIAAKLTANLLTEAGGLHQSAWLAAAAVLGSGSSCGTPEQVTAAPRAVRGQFRPAHRSRRATLGLGAHVQAASLIHVWLRGSGPLAGADREPACGTRWWIGM